MGERLRTAVVGLRMGKNHVLAVAGNAGLDLVAICDVNAETAQSVIEELEPDLPALSVYADYSAMLDEIQPEIVTIATPKKFHAEMAIEASEKGAKAICCEKPIAVDLGEARQMVEVCRENGTLLIVNHQRRLGADFGWMRRQIESGAIGNPYLVRGNCAGDMLSDGTHLIDSALFLAGDTDWSWVFASYHRDDSGGDTNTGGGYDVSGGWRFGHPVENGMFTVAELENSVKVELLTGDLRDPQRPYHDIEVIGTKGGLWRSGDKADGNLFTRASNGGWEPVQLPEPTASADTIAESYRRLAELIAEGGADSGHPLGADYSMRGFELLMGAYESARTGTIARPPVTQERYPLAVALGLDA